MKTGIYKQLQQGGSIGLGTSGQEVSNLQTQLNTQNAGKAGYIPLQVDGKYGPLTQAAVNFKSVIGNNDNLFRDTSAMRKKDTETGNKIDEAIANATGTTNPNNNPNNGMSGANVNTTNGDISGADGQTYKTTPPSGSKYNLPALSDGKKYVYDAGGRAMVQDAKGAITNDPYADQQYETNREFNEETAKQNAIYDDYARGENATQVSLIEGIKAQSAIMRKNQELLNNRTLGAKRVLGSRYGTQEYAPDIDIGIIKDEEQQGMDRLAQIDANMKLAIAQAESAKNAKDFALATKRFDVFKQLQKAKEESIQNIFKSYIDNNKIIADNLKAKEVEDRADRDQSLQELEVKAPELVKQYDALKTDAARKMWLSIMVKNTGLDEEILKGSIAKSRLNTENTMSTIKNRESTITKREQAPKTKSSSTTSKNRVAYTNTELKKLRDIGIDSTNTEMADAYLYRKIKPEDFKNSMPRLEAKNVKFSFTSNQGGRDQNAKIQEINTALSKGYKIQEIGEFLGLDAGIIKALDEAIKKSQNDNLL